MRKQPSLNILIELRGFANAEEAVTAVEFALVSPIFVALIIAVLQVTIIMFAQSYLDEVAETTARQVLTNQTYGFSTAQFNAQMCANIKAMLSCPPGAGWTVTLEAAPTTPAAVAAAVPTFNPDGTVKSTPPLNTSLSPGATVMLLVTYEWPTVSGPLGAMFGSLGNGDFLLTSTQVFQTELCTNASKC